MVADDHVKEEATILIVDDDSGHRYLIQRHLKGAGIRNDFIEFKSGIKLLNFLVGRNAEKNFEPGSRYIIILDVRMPEIDGIEILEHIRKDKRYKTIPIIILSTSDDPSSIERCYSLGCSGYLVKPIEFEGFASTISKLGSYINVMSIPHLN